MSGRTHTLIRAALVILIAGIQLVSVPGPLGGSDRTSAAFYCCCTGECHCTSDCCNHAPETTDNDDTGTISVNPGTALPAWQGGEHCGIWNNALQTVTQSTKPMVVQSRVDVLPPQRVRLVSRGAQPHVPSDDSVLWCFSPRAPPLSLAV